MEVILDSGVYLEILGIKRCHTEEEDGRARCRSTERGKGPHHRWVYLSADRIEEMGEYLAYNKKWLQKFVLEEPLEYKELKRDRGLLNYVFYTYMS